VAYCVIVNKFCEKQNNVMALTQEELNFLSKKIVPALVKELKFQNNSEDNYNAKTLTNLLQIFEISNLNISERNTKILLLKIEDFFAEIHDVDIKLLGFILKLASRFQNSNLLELAKSKQIAKSNTSIENDLALAFYGLYSCKKPYSSEAIEILKPYFLSFDQGFSTESIHKIMYGLFGQDPEICRPIIAKIADQIHTLEFDNNYKQLLMLAYGLFDQDPEICKPIVCKLAELIECFDQIDRKSVVMLTYLLSNQDPDLTSSILRKLSALIPQTQEDFTTQNLTMIFQGLLGKNKDDIDIMIDSLKDKLGSFERIDFSNSNAISLNPFLRALSIFLFKHPDQRQSLDPLLQNLKSKIANSDQTKSQSNNFTELVSAEVIKNFFSSTGLNCDVLKNEYIDGIEMDIYIPKLHLNIELDGNGHLSSVKNNQLRDEYLLNAHHIKTFRIDLRNLGDSESSMHYADSVARKVISDIRAYFKKDS
jgi:very-short-patch-repair endonuclease